MTQTRAGAPTTPAGLSTTRRGLFGGAALTVLLAACSREEAPEVPSSEAGFPRTVSHGLGSTEIPDRPRRVVATADREQLDVLLAMGVTPVQYGYSGDYDVAAPWLDAAQVQALDSADLPEAFTPNLELIAAVRPDLVLDSFSDETTHDDLSAIAPTVQVKASETDSWESAQRLAGEACGTEDAAETAIEETRGVLAGQAARLAQFTDLTVAVAFLQAGELLVLPGTAIGARVVSQLGLSTLMTDSDAGQTYSGELLGEVLGDVDVVLSFDDGLEEQEADALFRLLPAVVRGGYVRLPVGVATACYQESSLSLRWAAEPVTEALLLACEGRGVRL